MSTIEDKLDAEFAAAWRPDAGDKLAGEVVAIGERQGQYDPYPIVTLRRDDGEEFAIHAFHTVLGAQLAALRPKLGDRIAVKYIGKTQNKAGTGEYHGYRAVKDGADGGVDWSKYGVEPDGGSDLPSTDAQPDDFAATADRDDPLPF
jgi:hypothetical protein